MSPQLQLRTPAKGAVGTLVGLIPQRGEWLAAYVSVRLGKTAATPTLVDVCPISELPGPQRKKADIWKGSFARLIEATLPADSGNQ